MLNSKVALGTMNFASRTSPDESRRIMDRALERGVTVFDTANVYGDGESERRIGQALKGRRHAVRIATKVGLLRFGGKPEGLSRARILAACDESLARLQTDFIDVYYLHAPDPLTPIGESLEALAQLFEAKKIRAWGVSNFAAWQIGDLNVAAEARGLPRPAVSQVLYNLLVRQLDVEYFAFARAHPIHTTVYNPLAGGLLARVPDVGAPVPKGSRFETNALYRKRYWTDAMTQGAGQYAAVAAELGLDTVALAYAFLAGHPGIDSVLCGPASVAHLDAGLDGCAKTLTDAARNRIDAVHREFVGTDAKYAR